MRCVVGGGLVDYVPLYQVRMGVRTILIQDRAVLGGNIIRNCMWPWVLEGLKPAKAGSWKRFALVNLYHNSDRNYSVWDQVPTAWPGTTLS